MGDSTNMVLILAGELLKKAEHLLIMGLHPSEIIKGYELACIKALAELESTYPLKNSLTLLTNKLILRTLNLESTKPIHPRILSYGTETRHRIETVRV
jgi:chaperonin GroEL (HSP60 family)